MLRDKERFINMIMGNGTDIKDKNIYIIQVVK